jgi:hypothetical protein
LLTDHPLLRASGALLARWIEADLAAFGVEPAERRHEPAPRPLPDDGTCGMPCDGEFDAEPVPVEFMHSDEAGGAR